MNWLTRDNIEGIKNAQPIDNQYLGQFHAVPHTVYMQLLDLALAALEAREVMERTAKYGPKQGVMADGACAFCDMGGAGYSSRGDGFHDDDCGVMKAQAWLAKHGEKSDARNS